jgi:hypothetical protein
MGIFRGLNCVLIISCKFKIDVKWGNRRGKILIAAVEAQSPGNSNMQLHSLKCEPERRRFHRDGAVNIVLTTEGFSRLKGAALLLTFLFIIPNPFRRGFVPPG